MNLLPIRRQIVVAADPDLAYQVFTEEIGAWWPLAEYSVHGADADVAFRDGVIVETGPDGSEAAWGTVLATDPPHGLSFTWHPGRDPLTPTQVSVTFAALAEGQTLVTLEHSGWHVLADPEKSRTGYRQGWPIVLGSYRDRVGKPDTTPTGDVWLALMHTPGQAGQDVADLGGHGDFVEHVAFIDRMRRQGVLVAAGSLDERGDGMTVLRVPAAQTGEYLRLAQDDDVSVVRELLQVRVRPWRVAMTG